MHTIQDHKIERLTILHNSDWSGEVIIYFRHVDGVMHQWQVDGLLLTRGFFLPTSRLVTESRTERPLSHLGPAESIPVPGWVIARSVMLATEDSIKRRMTDFVEGL